ncbi:MAG: LamG domain-containing protein, partial [Bacteroidota bacterium]
MRQSFFFVMALLFGAFQSQAQICTRSQLPSNLQNGLVAYYPFCGNANDGSGNGNNGSVFGSILTADRFGVINSAYQFNGTSNYIQTNYAGIGSNGSRSFSLWFKTNQLFTLNPTNPGQNEEMDLLSYGAGGTGATIEVSLNHNCQGLSFDIFNGVFTKSAITSDNNWHHLVYVFDNLLGSDFANISMYLDGALVQTVKCMGATASTIMNTVLTNPLVIGSHFGHSIRHFKGVLDDVLIFNRPLLSCEITQLFNSTSTSIPQLGAFGFTPLADTTRVCGTSTTLNAGSGYSTYSWSTGSTAQTITATTSGFYKVTVTNAAGCTASDSTYLSLIKANIINNDTTICRGSSI